MNYEVIALTALKRKRDDHRAHVGRLNLAIEALSGGGATTKTKGGNAASQRMKKAWVKRKANAAKTKKAVKAAQVAAEITALKLRETLAVPESAALPERAPSSGR